MQNRRRWPILNLLLLAGILMLTGIKWRRAQPVSNAPADSESSGEAAAARTSAPTAPAPSTAVTHALTTQPVAYGRQQSALPRPDPFDIRDHVLRRAPGWESLPCQTAIDLSDMGDAYVLMLSVDDVTLDSVRLRLEGAVLTVMMQRPFHGGEIAFARSIMLPTAPDPALAPHCSLTNGALRIRLSKRLPQ